jgi:2-oxoglutarate dehydrogenase E2 component (dihydrolipoamide succinyltransferase)
MAIELKVPEVGESITEVMIGTWKKREGDGVAVDEPIVEIESDKATVELPAPTAGTVSRVLKGSGERARVGEVIGYMEPAGAAAGNATPSPAPAAPNTYQSAPRSTGSSGNSPSTPKPRTSNSSKTWGSTPTEPCTPPSVRCQAPAAKNKPVPTKAPPTWPTSSPP